MTSQTKRYIDLSDVLALKLECKACGTSLAVPISRDIGAREEILKLALCPMCRAPWASINGANYQPDIGEFCAKLKRLADTLKTAPVGFTLCVEIAGDEDPTLSAFRSSGDRR